MKSPPQPSLGELVKPLRRSLSAPIWDLAALGAEWEGAPLNLEGSCELLGAASGCWGPSGLGLMSESSDGKGYGVPLSPPYCHHSQRSQALSVSAAGLGIWEGWSLVPRAGGSVAATE